MNNYNKSVLIVEDELILSEALTDKFSSENFQVFVAKNGQQGLDLALKNEPDLIILDIIMPLMDGIEMLKRLRQDKKGKDMEVIILTNLNDLEMVSKTMDYKAYDYLVKSDWKIEDLINKIKDKLKLV